MPRRIASSTLNASTLDVLNVIRQNASYDYQQYVPVAVKATDIPRVGEVIYGTPAFANQFINALVNRIAAVRVQSANFNNPYAILKKGYLEYGESIEDIFVAIAKVVDYSPEKGEEREFKRTIPDVQSVFHVMNWRTIYPVTIQDEDLKQAFLSVDGVQNLIEKIVDSVYTAAEYDEFLLFKYLLIKAISHGKTKAVSIGDGTKLSDSAVQFRGISNLLPFLSSDYNESAVKTNTPKEKQIIFMDAMFNAQYDVNVLASAFNMDKADFMGRLFLIDNWTEFDNERFETIRAHSDGIEKVTATELQALANVKAVILDEDWFQVYDNNNKFTEKYVASGLYWNYFYHTWKTVSYSPFANAVTFVTNTVDIDTPEFYMLKIDSIDKTDVATVYTFSVTDAVGIAPQGLVFTQTEVLAKSGFAVQKYGALIMPKNLAVRSAILECDVNGDHYIAQTPITDKGEAGDTKVGDTIKMLFG